LRDRQVKNLLCVTLLSLGVPMLLMGDEVRRTQHGNNNAYCQDNEKNWLDWSLLTTQADLHRFVKLLTSRRLLRDSEPERRRVTLTQLLDEGIRGWHGVRLNQPDWSDHSHAVGLSVELSSEALTVYCIFNAYWEALEFQLPCIGGNQSAEWR